jgi:hypothetical protein
MAIASEGTARIENRNPVGDFGGDGEESPTESRGESLTDTST